MKNTVVNELIQAIKEGNTPLVEKLIDVNAVYSMVHSNQMIDYAVGNCDILEILLKHDINVSPWSFEKAVVQDKLKAIKLFLRYGYNWNLDHEMTKSKSLSAFTLIGSYYELKDSTDMTQLYFLKYKNLTLSEVMEGVRKISLIKKMNKSFPQGENREA